MVAIIFLVVYPYIFVEMGCEPFGFVAHFLLSVAPSDEEFYARQRRLRAMGAPMDPRAMPPSIALRAGSGGRLRLGSVELDTGLLTHSVRFTILLCWCAIMALGVFLCAPAGTARRTRKVRKRRIECARMFAASTQSLRFIFFFFFFFSIILLLFSFFIFLCLIGAAFYDS
jgi:hypothetical protein